MKKGISEDGMKRLAQRVRAQGGVEDLLERERLEKSRDMNVSPGFTEEDAGYFPEGSSQELASVLYAAVLAAILPFEKAVGDGELDKEVFREGFSLLMSDYVLSGSLENDVSHEAFY